MTPTEKARRSDSLHYDNVSRRALCDMIARLEDENERLKELAMMLFDCATSGCHCEKCKENNDGYACGYIMHELGMKVEQ